MSKPTAIKFLRHTGNMAFGPKGYSVINALANLVTINVFLGYGDFSESEKKEIAVAARKVDTIKNQLQQMFEMYKEIMANAESFLNGGEVE
jgi:hypothetical protein